MACIRIHASTGCILFLPIVNVQCTMYIIHCKYLFPFQTNDEYGDWRIDQLQSKQMSDQIALNYKIDVRRIVQCNILFAARHRSWCKLFHLYGSLQRRTTLAMCMNRIPFDFLVSTRGFPIDCYLQLVFFSLRFS